MTTADSGSAPFVYNVGGRVVATAQSVIGAQAIGRLLVACRIGHSIGGTASTADIISAMMGRADR